MKTATDWSAYLAAWQDRAQIVVSLIPEELLAADERDATFSTRLQRLGATQGQLDAAEHRLGFALPPDMAAFYRASNGWHQVGFDETDTDLLAVGDLHFLRDASEPLRAVLSGYAGVGEAEASDPAVPFMYSDVADLLVLSAPCPNGLYLFNPLRRSGKPAFLLIRYKFAPQRFATFSGLMQFEQQRCLQALRSMLG